LRERARVLLQLALSATDVKVRGQVLALVERLRARADELDARDAAEPDRPRPSPAPDRS
jgi:hypothetical protein